ncbi:TIGR04222 domain-containing membrane protein [Lentzea sp. HUAS12]|uniref:TIGR04222 domain-containing membrane protein n=1 Tax=Lentzea sp. HUAS12 TaxID=2951806 RepID=UPI00209F804B|nr:TIGR04222 domain-containing membrane protein [Lentzea sp. HUAS12]USX48060.1 TIGR04222 domain-containing membrane protein [Lentzea sp. HUAS12]
MATPATERGTRVPPERIGYLADGPGRAAETALARLLDAGLVRVSRDGLVSAVHQGSYDTTTPVEVCILTGLSRPVRFDAVVRNAAKSKEMRDLHDRLRAEGLTRRARPRLGVWWIFLVIGGVLALASLTEPWLLIGTVGFLGSAWWTYGAKPLTRVGRAALEDASTSDRVIAVALEGFRGKVSGRPVGDLFDLPQSVVKTLPRKRKRRGTGGGTASGSAGCGSGCGSSSCGSSCSSGGSSCGGGCGGGGGGD